MLGFPIADHAILTSEKCFFQLARYPVAFACRVTNEKTKVYFLENPCGLNCKNKTYKLSSLFLPYRQTQNVRTTSGLNTILLKLTRVYHNTTIAFI